MIESDHAQLSLRRQCDLLGLSRSSFYYAPAGETEENLLLMRLLDEQYTRTPFYGVLKMTAHLRGLDEVPVDVNVKRVRRLMRRMGLQALYPQRRTTFSSSAHQVYPYLLRGFQVQRPMQVLSADITYVPMQHGFMYLVAVIDWYSRYVVSWRLSNTLEGAFCLDALHAALDQGQPEIFNTDQGIQFTAAEFTGTLEEAGVRVSMDGRGRALDNVFVERLWRTVKYEDIYLRDYATVPELEAGLHAYFHFYNHERLHQSLDYQTPAAVHFAR